MLISILIPTRDRADELKTLLESLWKCMGNIHHQMRFPFEIIICDDGTDSTAEMVYRFKRQHMLLPIRYMGLYVPYDVDTKLIRMVKEAKGTYSWFMGSDDEVIPEAFRNFCEFILTKPVRKIIQVNFQDYDFILANPIGQEVIFPWAYKDYTSAEDFLHESKGRYGFMGATLYSTRLLKLTMSQTPDVYGFYFMASLLVVLKNPSLHATIYSPVVLKRRMGNTCWQNTGGDYIRNLINRVKLIDIMEEQKYGRFTVDKWRWNNYFQLYESIIAGRYRGLKEQDNLSVIIRSKYRGPVVRTVAWVLLKVWMPRRFLLVCKYLNNQFS